ncbi:hypothetical protein DV714_19680 [Parageobacillus thermoglucosidasius]|nr:hypothetical protein DV714_19680 [Parageobacillus thermoglucosidasius]
MIEYERVRWDSVKEYGNQVLLIDINNPVGVTVLDNPDRETLLKVDKYITHDTKDYNAIGKVFIYNIVDRAIDDKNNLILFVKSEMVQYRRY